jgi:Flp pilus assembly protein TadG
MNVLARFRRDEEGAVAVLATLCMPLFVACLAFVLDSGYMFIQRTQLQTAVDAAALAAAFDLPTSPSASGGDAQQYAGYNHVLASELVGVGTGQVTVHDGPCATNGCPAYKVTAQRTVPLSFAPAIGMSSARAKTAATAIASAASSLPASALLPYAIWDGNWQGGFGPKVRTGQTVLYRGNDWTTTNIINNPQHCGGNNQPPCNPNWSVDTGNNFNGYFNFTANQVITQNQAISNGGNGTGQEPLATICALAAAHEPAVMPLINYTTGHSGSNINFFVEGFVSVIPNPIPSCSGGVSMSTDFYGTVGPPAKFTSSGTPGGTVVSGEPGVYVLKLWY